MPLTLLDALVVGKPFTIISCFCHRWVFGWIGCRWYGWAGFFFGCGSLITMTALSLDRYLKICYLSYGKYEGSSLPDSLKLGGLNVRAAHVLLTGN